MLQPFAESVIVYLSFCTEWRAFDRSREIHHLKNALITIVTRIGTEDPNQELTNERNRLCRRNLHLGGRTMLKAALRIAR